MLASRIVFWSGLLAVSAVILAAGPPAAQGQGNVPPGPAQGSAAPPAVPGPVQRPAAPSPFVPGDLARPIFDTMTPVYDTLPAIEQSGASVMAEIEGRAITLGEIGDLIRSYPPAMAQLSYEALLPGVLDVLFRQSALVTHAQNEGFDEVPAVRRRMRSASDRVLADEFLTREAEKGVTEAALLERYKRDIEGRPGPVEVRARIIMVRTEKEAEALIAEVRGGADFGVLARRESKDATAVRGGDLGYVARDGVNAEVGAVIFALSDGQVAPYPVRSIGYWFVVRVEGRRQQATPGFQEAREGLRRALMTEAATRIAQAATDGMKVRRFDLTGKEVGEYTRPAR